MTQTEWPPIIDVGDGLALRAPDPIDAEAVADAINSSLDHLRPFMAWATGSTTVDQQAVRLAIGREAFDVGADSVYTIFDGATVVGGMGLHRRGGPCDLEIGYWVTAGCEGRGIITRCARALVALAFEGPVDRVVIRCDAGNVRSAAVPERLGFAFSHIEEVEPAAPANTGRMMVWELRRPAGLQ